MRRFPALFPAAALLVCAGCSMFEDAHSAKAGMRSAFSAGDYAAAGAFAGGKLESARGGGDETMWLLERGSAGFLKGEHRASLADFGRAEELIRGYDSRATVSASDLGGEAASALTNPTALPYRGWTRDRVLLNGYKALNYLALRDPDGAMVELRRLRSAQEEALRTFSDQIAAERKELERAGSKEEKRGRDGIAAALEADPEFAAARSESAVLARTGYGNALNPFAVFLSGMGMVLERDYNNALIDFRRLYETEPENPLARRLYVDALTRCGDRVPEALAGVKPDRFALHDGSVWLIAAVGRASGLREKRFELSVPLVGYTGIALPLLESGGAAPGPALGFRAGKDSGETVPIADLDAVTALEYQERLPGIITRVAVGYLVKEGIAAGATVAAWQADEVLGIVTLILTGFYKRAFNTADTRGWELLPRGFQAAVFPIPADRRIVFTPRNGAAERRLTLSPACRVAVIYVSMPGPGVADVRLFELDRLPD